MKRGSSGLCGVLAVDKPSGMTSHDVVNRIRRITGERRVGHAGTLDPMATGLMLVGIGAATRLTTYLTGHDKAYEARIVFGASTDTDDAQGRVLAGEGVDEPAASQLLDAQYAQSVLDGLVGSFDQMPPAYSAIKKNGTTAYKAAREGKALELEPRAVTVYDARFVACGTQDIVLEQAQSEEQFSARLPYWDVRLRVSKGTYIRSIARDLGCQLGFGAHLAALKRTSIADFSLDDAASLDDIAAAAQDGRALPWCDPVSLLGFPALSLTSDQVEDVANGRCLSADVSAGNVSCVSADKLMAVYRLEGSRLRPATVIPGGVAGVR